MIKQNDMNNFLDFKRLLKSGTSWIIMNLENGYLPADGLWEHLMEIRDSDCKTRPEVGKAYFTLKFIYMYESFSSFTNIVSGNYNFKAIWLLKIDENGSRDIF